MEMDDLNRALDLILPHEGKWSDHPNDRGGKTMYGVTIATFRAARRLIPGLPQHLEDLTPDQARTIYERMFWRSSIADQLPWPASYLQLDAAIQHSPNRSVRFLQKAIGADVDGLPGPLTRRLVGEVWSWRIATREMLLHRSIYYIRILKKKSQTVFASGWANRVEDVAGELL